MSKKQIITIISIVITIVVIAVATVLIINKNNKTTKTVVTGQNMEDTENTPLDETPEETPEETPSTTPSASPTPTISPTPYVAKGAYYIKVNNQMNTVTVYKQDAEGNYTVPVRAMICSTGYNTPKNSKYKIKGRWTWGLMFGGVYTQYETHITGDILFHSVPYLKKGDPSSLEWWLYDKLGTTCSAGCVRLTVADAKWIYDNVATGTTVEFYSSSNPGPLGKPSAMKISGYDTYLKNWDPTDPDPRNPWRSTDAQIPGANEPTPEPTIEPTIEPTQEPISTPVVTPTQTSTPTSTPVNTSTPISTPTVTNTETPTPTPTSTSTPVQTPTPTPTEETTTP